MNEHKLKSGRTVAEPNRMAVLDALRLVGGRDAVAKEMGLFPEQVRRWTIDGTRWKKITPEEARILSKMCNYRIKVDEMCPGAYKGLSQKELSFTVRK